MFTSLSSSLERGRNLPTHSQAIQLVASPRGMVSSYHAAQQWLEDQLGELYAVQGYYRVISMGNYVPELSGEWDTYALEQAGWRFVESQLLATKQGQNDQLGNGAWLDQWLHLARVDLEQYSEVEWQSAWSEQQLASCHPENFAARWLAWLWHERSLPHPAQEQTCLSSAAQELEQRYLTQPHLYVDERLWQDFPVKSYLRDLSSMAQRATLYWWLISEANTFSIRCYESGIIGVQRQRNQEQGFSQNIYGELALQGQVYDAEWADVEDYVTPEHLRKFQQPLQELQARMGRIYLRYALDTTYQRHQQLDSESLDYANLVDDVENCEIEPNLAGNHEERLFLSTILTHLDYNPRFQIGNLASGEGYKVHYPTQVINDLNLVRKGLRGTDNILYLSRALLLAPCHMRGYGASQFHAADNAYFFASAHVARAIKDLEQLQLFAYDQLLTPNVANYPALEQSLALGAPALERVALRSLEAQLELGHERDWDEATEQLLEKATYFSKLNQPVFPHLQALYDKLDGGDHVGLRILADGEAVGNNRPTPSTYFQLHAFQEHQLWFQPWLTLPELVEYPKLNDFFEARQGPTSYQELFNLENVVVKLHSLRLTPIDFVKLQTSQMGRRFLSRLLFYSGHRLAIFSPLLILENLHNRLLEEEAENRKSSKDHLNDLSNDAWDEFEWDEDEWDEDESDGKDFHELMEDREVAEELDQLFAAIVDRLDRKTSRKKSSGKAKATSKKKNNSQAEPALLKEQETKQHKASRKSRKQKNAAQDVVDAPQDELEEYVRQEATQLIEQLQDENSDLYKRVGDIPLDFNALNEILEAPDFLELMGISPAEFQDMIGMAMLQQKAAQSQKTESADDDIMPFATGFLEPGENMAQAMQRIVAENRDVFGEDFEIAPEELERLSQKVIGASDPEPSQALEEAEDGIVPIATGFLEPGENMAQAMQRIVAENRDVLGEDFEIDPAELERLSQKVIGASEPEPSQASSNASSSERTPSSKQEDGASQGQGKEATQGAQPEMETTGANDPYLEVEGNVRSFFYSGFTDSHHMPNNNLDGYPLMMAAFIDTLKSYAYIRKPAEKCDKLDKHEDTILAFRKGMRAQFEVASRNPDPELQLDYARDGVNAQQLLGSSGQSEVSEAQEWVNPHTWISWKHAFALPTTSTPFLENESQEAFYARTKDQRARSWQQVSLRVKAREYDLRGQLARLRQLQNRSLVRLTPASYMEWDFISHYYTGFQANGWVARDGAIQPLEFKQITTAQDAHALWLGHAILATKTAYQQFMLAWSSHNRDSLTGTAQGRRHQFAQAITLALDPQARATAQAARQALGDNRAESPQHLFAQLRTPELDDQGRPLTSRQTELLGCARNMDEVNLALASESSSTSDGPAQDLEIATNCDPVLGVAKPSTPATEHEAARAQAQAQKIENYINVLTQVGEQLHNANTLGLTKIAELEQRFDGNEREGDAHYKHLLGLTRMHLETALREEANLAATDWQLRLDRARNWSRAWNTTNLAQQATNLEDYIRFEVQRQQLSTLQFTQSELQDLGKPYKYSAKYIGKISPKEIDRYRERHILDFQVMNRNYGLVHTGMGEVLRRRYRPDGQGMLPCAPLPHELQPIFSTGKYVAPTRQAKVVQFPELTPRALHELDGQSAMSQRVYQSNRLSWVEQPIWSTNFWKNVSRTKLDFNWGSAEVRESIGMKASQNDTAYLIVSWLRHEDWVLTPSLAQHYAQEYMAHSVQDDYHRTQKYAKLSGLEQQLALRTLKHDDMIRRLSLWGQNCWREIEERSRRLIFRTDLAHAPGRIIETGFGVLESDAQTSFQFQQLEEERVGLLSDIRAYEANLAARLQRLAKVLEPELKAYTEQFADATSLELLVEVAASCIEQDLYPFLAKHQKPRAQGKKGKKDKKDAKGSKNTPPPRPQVSEAVLAETIQRSVVRHLRTALSVLEAEPMQSARLAAWKQASDNLQSLLNVALIIWSFHQVEDEADNYLYSYNISRASEEQPYVRSELEDLIQQIHSELLDNTNLFGSAHLINSATEMAARMWEQGSELRSFIELYAPTMQETPLGRSWLRSYLENHHKLLGLDIDLELALQNHGKSELGVPYRMLDSHEERHYQALRATRIHTSIFTLLRGIIINQRWAAQGLEYHTEWQKNVKFKVGHGHHPAIWRELIESALDSEAAQQEGVDFDYKVVHKTEPTSQAERASVLTSTGSFRSVRVHADSNAQLISAPRLLTDLPLVYQGLNRQGLNQAHNPDVPSEADHHEQGVHTPHTTTHLSYNGLGGDKRAPGTGNYQLQSPTASSSKRGVASAGADYAQTAQQLESNSDLEAQLVRQVQQVAHATSQAAPSSIAPAQAGKLTALEQPAPSASGATVALASSASQARASGATSDSEASLTARPKVSIELVDFAEREAPREPLVRIEVATPEQSTKPEQSTASEPAHTAQQRVGETDQLARVTSGLDGLMPEAVQELYQRHLRKVQVHSFAAQLRAQVADLEAIDIPFAQAEQVCESRAQALDYFNKALLSHLNSLLVHTPVQGELQVPGLALLEAVLLNRHLAGEQTLPTPANLTNTSIEKVLFQPERKLLMEFKTLGIEKDNLELIYSFKNAGKAGARRICNFGYFGRSLESGFELLQELRLYTLLRLQLQGRINLSEQHWEGYQARVRKMTMLHHLLRNTQVFYQKVNQACYFIDSHYLAPFLAYSDVSPSELQYLTYRLATETPVWELSPTFLGLVRGSYVFNHLQPLNSTAQQQLCYEKKMAERAARSIYEKNQFSIYYDDECWDDYEHKIIYDLFKAEFDEYLARFYPSHDLSTKSNRKSQDLIELAVYKRFYRELCHRLNLYHPVYVKLPKWMSAYKSRGYYDDYDQDDYDYYSYPEVICVPYTQADIFPEYQETDWSNSFARVMRKVYDPEQWHVKQASLWLDSFNYMGWEHYPQRLTEQAQLQAWGNPQLVTRLLPHKMLEGLVFQYLLRFEQYHDLEGWLMHKLGGLEQVSDFTTMSLSQFWNLNEQGNWGRMWQRVVGAVLDDSLSFEDCWRFDVGTQTLVGEIPRPMPSEAPQQHGTTLTLAELEKHQKQLHSEWQKKLSKQTLRPASEPDPTPDLFPRISSYAPEVGNKQAQSGDKNKKHKKNKTQQANTLATSANSAVEVVPASAVLATGLVAARATTQLAQAHATPWVNYFYQLETATLLYEELGHATLASLARAQQQVLEQQKAQLHLAEQEVYPYFSPSLSTGTPVFWCYREPGYLSAPGQAAPELALYPVSPQRYNPLEYTDIDMHERKWQDLETGYASLQSAADLNVNELVNSMNEYVNLLRVPVTNLVSDLDWTLGSNDPELEQQHDAARRAAVRQAIAQHQAQDELMQRRAQYLYALRAQLEGGLHDRVYLHAIAQLTPSLRAATLRMGDAHARLSSIEASYVQQQLRQQFVELIAQSATPLEQDARRVLMPHLRGFYHSDSATQPAGEVEANSLPKLSHPLQLHWLGYAAQYECNLADYRVAQQAVEQAVRALDPQLLASYYETLVQLAQLQDQREFATYASSASATAPQQTEQARVVRNSLPDYSTWTEQHFVLAEQRAQELAVRALYLGGIDEPFLADLTLQAEQQQLSLAEYVSQLVRQDRQAQQGVAQQLEQILAAQRGILPVLQAVTRLQVVGQRFLDLGATRATANLWLTQAQRAYVHQTDRYLQQVFAHPQHELASSASSASVAGFSLSRQRARSVPSGLMQLPWDAALRLHDQGMTVSATLSLTAVAEVLESWTNLPYHLDNHSLAQAETGWYFQQLPLSYHLNPIVQANRALWQQPLATIYPYLTASDRSWGQYRVAAHLSWGTTMAGRQVYYPSQGLQALVDYYTTHAEHFQARLLANLPCVNSPSEASVAAMPRHTSRYKLTYTVPAAWRGQHEGEARLLAIATRTEWLCTLSRHAQHPAARQALPAFDRWQQAQSKIALLQGAERELLEVATAPLATSLPMHAEQALRMQQAPLYGDLILQRGGTMGSNLLALAQLDPQLTANIQAYLAQLPTQSGVLKRATYREDERAQRDSAELDTVSVAQAECLAPMSKHEAQPGSQLVYFLATPAEQQAALAQRVRELSDQAGLERDLCVRSLPSRQQPKLLGELEVTEMVDAVAAPAVLRTELGDYTVRYTRAQIDYQLLSELQIIVAHKEKQDYLTTQVNCWLAALLDHNYRVIHQVLANVNEPSLALNFIQYYALTSHRWLSEAANSLSVLVGNDYLRLLTEMRQSVNVIQDLLRALAAGSQPAYAYFLTHLLYQQYTPDQRLASDYIRAGVLPTIGATKPKRQSKTRLTTTYPALAELNEEDLNYVVEHGLVLDAIGKGRALRQLTSYLNFQRYNLLGLRSNHPQESVMQLLDCDGFDRVDLGTQNTADQWLRLLSVAQAVSPLQVAAFAYNFKVSNLTSHESMAVSNNILEHVACHAQQVWNRQQVLVQYEQLRGSSSPLVLPQATLADAEQQLTLRRLYQPYQLLHYQRATLTLSTSQFDYQAAMALILKGFFPVHLRGTSDQCPTLNWKEDYPFAMHSTVLCDYLTIRPRHQAQLGGMKLEECSLFNKSHLGFAWNNDQEFLRSYAVDLRSEPARNSEAEQSWRKEHGLGMGHEYPPPAVEYVPPPVDIVAQRTPRTQRQLETWHGAKVFDLNVIVFNYELSDYFARGVYGLPWARRRELHAQLEYYSKVMGMAQGYFNVFTHLQRPTSMYVRQDELLTSIQADYIFAQAAQGQEQARSELEALYTPGSAAVAEAQARVAQRANVARKYASTPVPAEAVRGQADQNHNSEAGQAPSGARLDIELHHGAVQLSLPAPVPTSWGWFAPGTTPTPAQRELNRWLRAQARSNYFLRLDGQSVQAARQATLASLSRRIRGDMFNSKLRDLGYYQAWRRPL